MGRGGMGAAGSKLEEAGLAPADGVWKVGGLCPRPPLPPPCPPLPPHPAGEAPAPQGARRGRAR